MPERHKWRRLTRSICRVQNSDAIPVHSLTEPHTLNIVETRAGVPRDARTPFERWVEDDLDLEIVRGYAAGPLGTMPVRPWTERNASAVFIDLIGGESLAGMYVLELAPGEASTKVRSLSEETFYVLRGRGSAAVDTPHGTMTFEWAEHSLFVIPLNCPYRLFNGSGQQPARLVSTNTLPIVYSLYRDPSFVFGTAYDFDRFGASAVADPGSAVLYKPDAQRLRTAVDLYDTMFIPDIYTLGRSDFRERGEGTRTVYIEMAKSAISNHVTEIPGRRFFNPHRHGPSASVFTLTGRGYSLMWPDGGEMIRFDWPEDDVGVIVPPNMWWHGHFVTTPSALTLAVKLRSRFFPINHLFEKTHIPVVEGGTVLRFEDLDERLRRRLWDTFVEECEKQGFEAVPPVMATGQGAI